MRPLLKKSALTVLAVMLSISAVCDVVGQSASEKKKDIKPKNTTLQPAMVHVEGGCYDMGDTFGDGSSDELPLHTVCLQDFDIGAYEVTQGQWREIMKSSPSNFDSCGDDCPVEEVSWYEAQEFIKKLNARTGKEYRLPTEAEWEFAARSGGKHEKWSGTSKEQELGMYAWYVVNAGNSVHPVGRKKPNGLGIYDMSGNVWEWVQDVYAPTAYALQGKKDRTRTGSVTRGGGWKAEAMDLRSSNRFYAHPAHRYNN